MSPLLLFTPLLLVFEIAQLVIAERYLGIRRLEEGVDPRTLPMREWIAFIWSAGIVLYWAWMIGMLFQNTGRPQAVLMILITAAGYFLRRSSTVKWVLVILTFEGALRVGMLLSIIGLMFRRYGS